METLLSTSLHVASKIHVFFLASRAWGFGTALQRAAKIPSSLIGEVGGRKGVPLAPPEIFGLFPQGGAAEASQNHIVV